MFLHGLFRYRFAQFITEKHHIINGSIKDFCRAVPFLIICNIYIFSKNKQLIAASDQCKVVLHTTAIFALGIVTFNYLKSSNKIVYH